MTSWRKIRGLTFSTIGRTVRATVHRSDGDTNNVWFDPPNSWRIENADGSPQTIENDSAAYRFGVDGIAVHSVKAPNIAIMEMGLSSALLFTMYRWWPEPGRTTSPRVGEPSEPIATEVRGRPGWQITFDSLTGREPITVVIDAELGLVLSWHQGQQWLEMSDPVLDEQFDPGQFTWDGPQTEFDDQIAAGRLEYEQKMRDLADVPTTQASWLPTTIEVTTDDGDPMTGSLEVTAVARSPQFVIRRWLTGLGEPDARPVLDYYSALHRTELGPWTVELRAHESDVSPDDVERIVGGLTLPDPPGAVDEIRTTVERIKQTRGNGR